MKNVSLLKNFLFVGILFILNSCQNDETENEHHAHSEKGSSISFNQFKLETDIANFFTIFRTRSTTNNPAFRGAVSPGDFVIDTTAIEKHAGKNGIISYSFFAYPVNHEIAGENEIFNLVYYKENTKWETIILSAEKITADGSHNHYENIKEVYSSSSRNAVCWGTMYTFHCTKTGPCAGGTCDMCNLCVSSSAYPITCGEPEPEDPGTGTGTDPDIGINPGGGGLSVTKFMNALQLDQEQLGWLNVNPFFKARLIESYIGVDTEAAVAGIRDEFKAKLQYMMNNYDMCQNITAYVVEQQYRAEAQKFAWKLVNLGFENNTTVGTDNTLDKNNAIHFNSIQDFQGFLDNLNDSEASNFSLEQNQGNTKTARLSFDLGAFAYLNVQVKQQLPASDFEILGITSSISGLTILLEWQQNDDFDTTTNGNIVEVTFTGTLSMNCFIEGVGIFYSDMLTIKIKVDKTTGQAVSGKLYGLD